MRNLLSEAFSPWMRGIEMLTGVVERDRRPLPENHPMLVREREAIAEVTDTLKRLRELRDEGYEKAFSLLFDSRSDDEKLQEQPQGTIRLAR